MTQARGNKVMVARENDQNSLIIVPGTRDSVAQPQWAQPKGFLESTKHGEMQSPAATCRQ